MDREVEEGSERENRSKCSNEGSEAAGLREDVFGGDPTRSDVRDGAERLRDEPE